MYFRWLESWSWSDFDGTSWKRNAYAKRSQCHRHHGIFGFVILSKYNVKKFNEYSIFWLWNFQLIDFHTLVIMTSFVAACNWNWDCSFPLIFVENVLWEAWWLQGIKNASCFSKPFWLEILTWTTWWRKSSHWSFKTISMAL